VGVEGRWGIADNTNDLNILNKEKKWNKKNGNDDSTKTKAQLSSERTGWRIGKAGFRFG
jgi:hypothetical protein